MSDDSYKLLLFVVLAIGNPCEPRSVGCCNVDHVVKRDEYEDLRSKYDRLRGRCDP